MLGAPNDSDGVLSAVSVSRCEAAITEYGRAAGSVVLPTGGFGPHFNTTKVAHGVYVIRSLTARGIPSEDILEPVLSSNTIEDASMCAEVVLELDAAEVVLCTSDFHVQRASILFQRALGERELRVVGARAAMSADERAAAERHEAGALRVLRADGSG